jgi:hypothetical protein
MQFKDKTLSVPKQKILMVLKANVSFKILITKSNLLISYKVITGILRIISILYIIKYTYNYNGLKLWNFNNACDYNAYVRGMYFFYLSLQNIVHLNTFFKISWKLQWILSHDALKVKQKDIITQI